MQVKMPKWATIALGVVGVILQTLNYSVVPVNTDVHAVIAAVIFFLVAAGIPPLTGSTFQGAIHLPAGVAYVISGAMGFVLVILTTVHLDGTVHEVLAVAITVATTLGFSSAVSATSVGAIVAPSWPINMSSIAPAWPVNMSSGGGNTVEVKSAPPAPTKPARAPAAGPVPAVKKPPAKKPTAAKAPAKKRPASKAPAKKKPASKKPS